MPSVMDGMERKWLDKLFLFWPIVSATQKERRRKEGRTEGWMEGRNERRKEGGKGGREGGKKEGRKGREGKSLLNRTT